MKKMLKLLLSATMLATLLAGMQITAFAALTSSVHDEANSPAAGETSLVATERTDTANNNDTSRLHDEATPSDINPISANPETGSGNLAIPAIVALLAASTAAIAISAKKKD